VIGTTRWNGESPDGIEGFATRGENLAETLKEASDHIRHKTNMWAVYPGRASLYQSIATGLWEIKVEFKPLFEEEPESPVA